MSVPPADTPTRDAPAAPSSTTADFAPAGGSTDRQALAIRLAPSDGSLPQLTGEIRDLVDLRLREVALLVTCGWGFVLLLCLSGLDGLFNVAHLGPGCVAAIGFAVAAFAACWAALSAGPRFPLAQLRGFEAVYLWGRSGARRGCGTRPSGTH